MTFFLDMLLYTLVELVSELLAVLVAVVVLLEPLALYFI
jgi:hypothetical protein